MMETPSLESPRRMSVEGLPESWREEVIVEEQSPSLWQIWVPVLVRLFKLRVVTLLLWVAFGGALVTAGPEIWSWEGGKGLLAVFLSGLLAAGGASALNEYMEQDLDARMARTRKRPLPQGLIAPRTALVLGLVALILGIGLGWWYRPMLGLFVAAGAFIYVVVYTWGLKRRSVTNIVIGGAAGSAAVLSGAAAVGYWDHPAAWVLAGLVFLWTPVHFWALALRYREDYRAAGFPMLPAVTSRKQAAGWIALHAGATAIAALALAAFLHRGGLYLPGAILLALWLFRHVGALWRQPDDRQALRTFLASNLYLAATTLWAMLVSVIP